MPAIVARSVSQSKLMTPPSENLTNTALAKMIGGGRPLLRENLADTDPLQNADFQSTFVRSASAITAMRKKVELTLLLSPLCAFQIE